MKRFFGDNIWIFVYNLVENLHIYVKIKVTAFLSLLGEKSISM